jgi:hypothetical protein
MSRAEDRLMESDAAGVADWFAGTGMPSTYTYKQVTDAEKREQQLTDAYASGRADECAEWKPVLEAVCLTGTSASW